MVNILAKLEHSDFESFAESDDAASGITVPMVEVEYWMQLIGHHRE